MDHFNVDGKKRVCLNRKKFFGGINLIMAAFLGGLRTLETTVLLPLMQVEVKKRTIKDIKEGECTLLGSCPRASQAAPSLHRHTENTENPIISKVMLTERA